jgi:hypothetical protein
MVGNNHTKKGNIFDKYMELCDCEMANFPPNKVYIQFKEHEKEFK